MVLFEDLLCFDLALFEEYCLRFFESKLDAICQYLVLFGEACLLLGLKLREDRFYPAYQFVCFSLLSVIQGEAFAFQVTNGSVHLHLLLL